jgi:hypothetical protein
MRALSIRQPWVDLILAGEKPIENRSWSTNHRGPLLIHAGKRQDVPARAWIESKGLVVPDDLMTGGIVGVVDVIDCVQGHPSDWAMEGHWHWILARPRSLPFVELTGKLGLWETGIEIPAGFEVEADPALAGRLF